MFNKDASCTAWGVGLYDGSRGAWPSVAPVPGESCACICLQQFLFDRLVY